MSFDRRHFVATFVGTTCFNSCNNLMRSHPLVLKVIIFISDKVERYETPGEVKTFQHDIAHIHHLGKLSNHTTNFSGV